MTGEVIDIQRLVGFKVSVDGARFSLTAISAEDRPLELSLPSECLKMLLMTLPRMAQQTLHAQYQDDSLRLVYPANEIRIEQSHDPHVAILTFTSPDGFEVSFAVGWWQMAVFSDARDAAAELDPTNTRSPN